MAINYKVVACTNPVGDAGLDYACNRAIKSSDYDFDALAEDIQFATTLTKADITAVLMAAKEYVKKGLLAGQRIVLNELGALQMSLHGKCYPQSQMTSPNFDPSTFITGVGIRFRPEAGLLKYVRSGYSVKRVPSDLMA